MTANMRTCRDILREFENVYADRVPTFAILPLESLVLNAEGPITIYWCMEHRNLHIVQSLGNGRTVLSTLSYADQNIINMWLSILSKIMTVCGPHKDLELVYTDYTDLGVPQWLTRGS